MAHYFLSYDISAMCSSMNALEEFNYQIACSWKNNSGQKKSKCSRTIGGHTPNCRRCLMGKKISPSSPKTWYLSLCVLMSIIEIVSGKCYTTKPELTIPGAEYRKEYELRYDTCGRACFNDASCMAFEWRKGDGECTLKAKSLNGTFIEKSGVHFGLCFDRADPENMRDLFYDHEFGGVEYASTINAQHDECLEFCMENAKDGASLAHLAYSWRPNDPKNQNQEENQGKCMCIVTLHYVKLQFGSMSAYLK